MKKILSIFTFMAIMCVITGFAHASSDLSQVVTSTYAVTGASSPHISATGAITPDIAGTSKIMQIVIDQPSTVEQTISFYEYGASSDTINLVGTYTVPGTAGLYYPFGTNALSNLDGIKWRDFVVRTSTSVTPCKVNVIKGN